jgi:hypothetical protein
VGRESPRALIYQIHTARRHLTALTHAGQRCNAERPLFSAEERIYAAEANIEDWRVDSRAPDFDRTLGEVLQPTDGSLGRHLRIPGSPMCRSCMLCARCHRALSAFDRRYFYRHEPIPHRTRQHLSLRA